MGTATATPLPACAGTPTAGRGGGCCWKGERWLVTGAERRAAVAASNDGAIVTSCGRASPGALNTGEPSEFAGDSGEAGEARAAAAERADGATRTTGVAGAAGAAGGGGGGGGAWLARTSGTAACASPGCSQPGSGGGAWPARVRARVNTQTTATSASARARKQQQQVYAHATCVGLAHAVCQHSCSLRSRAQRGRALLDHLRLRVSGDPVTKQTVAAHPQFGERVVEQSSTIAGGDTVDRPMK